MYYDPYDYMDADSIYALYQFSAGMYVVSLIIAVFMIVCMWKIFIKAHEEGWAAIVPFYNTYVLYKITWGNGWFFLLLLIPFANFLIYIITLVKLAKVFGKGGGFACGLIFLPVIFFPILAFSKDIEYVGIQGKQVEYGPGAGTWQDPYQQNTYQQNTYTQTSSQNSEYHYQRTEQPSGGFTGKYCPHCGKELESGSKFCASCGNKL